MVVLDLPISDFDRFLEKLHQRGCPESAILHGASYIRRPNSDRYLRTMQIKCDLVQAKRLLRLAVQLSPSAATAIQIAIDRAQGEN